jgi:predicted ArsR family transcriptional regulator
MIEAQSAPVSIAALAVATGLHENTVRGHLEQLHADGYVRREREESAGRGRPAWLWRATRATVASPYAGLTSALAETLVRTSPDPVAAAQAAGRAWGAEIAGRESEDASDDASSGRESVVAVMRENGFAPDDTGDVVLLRRCPLIEAATRHPEVVCAVHQGMIDGILASHGDTARSRLVPFTAPGVCTLHLRAS